jgi:hypothetical protein
LQAKRFNARPAKERERRENFFERAGFDGFFRVPRGFALKIFLSPAGRFFVLFLHRLL